MSAISFVAIARRLAFSFVAASLLAAAHASADGWTVSVVQRADSHIVAATSGQSLCSGNFLPQVTITGQVIELNTTLPWLLCSQIPIPFTTPVDLGVLADGDYSLTWSAGYVPPAPSPLLVARVQTAFSIVGGSLANVSGSVGTCLDSPPPIAVAPQSASASETVQLTVSRGNFISKRVTGAVTGNTIDVTLYGYYNSLAVALPPSCGTKAHRAASRRYLHRQLLSRG